MNNKTKNINILIIDDHPFLKEGVELRVSRILPDANCFFTSNIRSALVQVLEYGIDLVFCDLEFDNESDYDGFYFIKEVLIVKPNLKVIAFTNYNSYRIMNNARKSGFSSFLLKTCSFNEFSDTLVNVINSNDEYISLSMQGIIKKRNKIKRSIFSDSLYGISNLSNHELKLVILSAKTTDRIILAESMNKSAFTIDSYYKSIFRKLNIRSRSEVQFFAIEFMEELLKRKNTLL